MSDAQLAVGVDASRGGWVAVGLNEGRFEDASQVRDIHDVFTAFPQAATVAVDIPIGLPTRGRRGADVMAREFVGPRRNSVFFVPPLSALEAPSFGEANAVATELTGLGLSQQAYALGPKVREVRAARDKYGDRLREIHPEVSFRALAARPLEYPKTTWNGLSDRMRLLARVGIELPARLAIGGKVRPDDLLDAAAAAWSANRLTAGEAERLPAEGARNDSGEPMEIWY